MGNYMNWHIIEGKWGTLKGRVKEKWGKLTDNDLMVVNGKKDQLVAKIQERYGIAVEEAQNEVEKFSTEFKEDETNSDKKDNSGCGCS